MWEAMEENLCKVDNMAPNFCIRRVYTFCYLGHLLFNIGNTEVLIKIKKEITAPKPERPN